MILLVFIKLHATSRPVYAGLKVDVIVLKVGVMIKSTTTAGRSQDFIVGGGMGAA